jgi:para-aminobenzoate synthetase component I
LRAHILWACYGSAGMEMASHVHLEEVAYRDPLDLLAAFGAESGLVFLDSAMAHGELGRWSWLAAEPFGRFTSNDGGAAWNGALLPGHPITALRATLQRFAVADLGPASRFVGGATGFVSYEAGRLFEKLPAPKSGRASCPEIDLAFHDAGLAFDHVERRLFLVSTGWPESDPARRRRRAAERAEWLRDRLAAAGAPRWSPRVVLPRAAWRANTEPEQFRAHVERVRRFIAAGDIFQANLTQAWRAELPAGFDPLALYAQLRLANPAPFAALLVTPERVVASSSPEGFLSCREGRVETRPIKGTARRSADPAEDRRLAEGLLASEKDWAENVMIVDLMRNDLSRVCRPGTVEVPVLCGLESYAAVHHLVSVVRGELKAGLDALHLLAACFPGGSITGAPKIRAMEIIHALEPEPRGVYCGSIVHLGFDGSLASSIAIRTLVAENGAATVNAGGGVTLLSEPEAEYAETLLKAERMFQAFEPLAQVTDVA